MVTFISLWHITPERNSLLSVRAIKKLKSTLWRALLNILSYFQTTLASILTPFFSSVVLHFSFWVTTPFINKIQLCFLYVGRCIAPLCLIVTHSRVKQWIRWVDGGWIDGRSWMEDEWIKMNVFVQSNPFL